MQQTCVYNLSPNVRWHGLYALCKWSSLGINGAWSWVTVRKDNCPVGAVATL